MELNGVQNREWNPKRPLVFTAVILHMSGTFSYSKKIVTRNQKQVDLWDKGR